MTPIQGHQASGTAEIALAGLAARLRARPQVRMGVRERTYRESTTAGPVGA
jgi:hypothetical protein